MDKYKTGLGYNAVPPPYTRNFMPPKSDLVYHSLDDFVDVNESVSESVVKKPTVETNEPETFRKENEAPIIKDWVSDSDKENVPKVKTVEMFNKPSFAKINFVKSIEQVKSPKKTPVDKNRQKTPSPRGNKRNWNQQMSQKLGSDFEMLNKACHGNPQQDLKDKGVINSGCSRYMTGNRPYLTDYEEIDGGFVTFGGIENLIDLLVKVIRCNNGTEFKNRVMNQFCEMNGIKREFSVARTPQQNRKTCLKLPFECLVTILNTIDHLGKFDGKTDVGFFIGYSSNSKAFRVFNNRTRIVEENPHVQFSGNTPNIAGSGPNWLFDIDALTKSMNYKPVVAGNQSNGNADIKACNDARKTRMEIVPGKDYILLLMWPTGPLFSQDSKSSPDARFKLSGEEEKKDTEDPGNEDSEVPSTEETRVYQEKDDNVSSTKNVNTASNTINTVSVTPPNWVAAE
ncbi:ribonuclease H-like domain-containing protein [Tanacetum coccineum]